MSSIHFDPATSSGNPAGARNASNTANNAAGGPSFDSFLAKNQSRYEASSALRSERSESDRGYDKDHDYKSSRADERDYEKDSTGRSEGLDDDTSRWDDEEDLSVDAAEGDSAYGESEVEEEDSSAETGEAGVAQTAEPTETGDPTLAAAAGAATSSGTAANGNANASTANTAQAAASATAGNTANTQTSQSANASAAAAPQQATAAKSANGNQAAQGESSKQSSATASVSNNALVSQSNTALTSGSAVVTLQSVEPKISLQTGQAPLSDPMAKPQLNGEPAAAAEVKPVANAAQAAKAQQQLAQNAQATAAQAAAVNQGATQSGPANMSALPAGPADVAAGVNAPQATAGTGTPAFTSLAPVGGVTQTANATGAGAAASGNASAAAATPSDQVAVEIRKGVAAGKDSITIKLNPAELGKIDVKMEINDDGTLRASIAVEKSETLDLLQKDTRGLERALQNAGLQADSGSLNFSLSGQGNNSAEQFETTSNSGSGADGDTTEDPAAESQQNSRSSHDGALDISV